MSAARRACSNSRLIIVGCASVILSIMAFVGTRELGRRQPPMMYAPPTQTILVPMHQPSEPPLYYPLPERRSTVLRTAGMVVGWGLLLGLVVAALMQGDRKSGPSSPQNPMNRRAATWKSLRGKQPIRPPQRSRHEPAMPFRNLCLKLMRLPCSTGRYVDRPPRGSFTQ